MLPQRVQLAGRDLVCLDGFRLSMEGAHVLDEAARDRGRQLYEFWHGLDVGAAADNCESRTVFGVILLRARFLQGLGIS
jgi:hypothetical protein